MIYISRVIQSRMTPALYSEHSNCGIGELAALSAVVHVRFAAKAPYISIAR